MNVVIIITVQIGIFSQVVGLCSFPQEWDGLWYDSRKKEVTLNRNTSAVQSGWTLTAYTSTVTSWTCVEQSIDKYLMKGDQEVDVFGAPNAAYLCLTVKKITDVSYRYTIVADEQSNAENERVSMISTTRNATISSDCTAVSPPGTEEFHVLVKADNTSDVKQYFPEPLLATLYNSNFARTNSTCDSDFILDMCSDRYIMNRTECSTSSGQVLGLLYFCVTYVQDDSTYFVSMLDPGVTGSNQQHFKCYAVMKLNNQVYISDNNGSCAKGQDPNVKQVNGTETLVMYANVLCPFTTSPNEEDVDIGVIIGSVIASIIFIGIITAIIILCLRKKYREKIRKLFCSKCKHKIQQKDDQKPALSEKKKTQSNGKDDDAEANNNDNQNISMLCDDLKKSTQEVSREDLTSAKGEGACHENSRDPIMTPVELLDNTVKDVEVGKAPVDVQKHKQSGMVVDHTNFLSEIEDEDSAVRIKEREKEKSIFLRQNTEEDMEQLRRINKEVNSEKHVFLKENIPFDNEMTTSEQIYFQKSVFAKQNVEAEMYLNEPIDESDDHAILSSSLPVILEAHEGISHLNLKGVTSSPIHTTSFVPNNRNSPQTKKDNCGMDDTGEIKGMVIEDLDFSLTEEQIIARSSLSSALTSRLSSRMTPTSEILAIELRRVLSPSKRISRKTSKPRSLSRYSFHSAPEMRTKTKRYSERYHVKPVLKRASTKMSILKIASLKRKVREMENEPRAPKMKFRWI
ncbi:uncharacterized protein LOC133192971 [Saccostrea echinata]|uniref:uncharacterized protein LOC133192971 n=1 Tax=Saccostrea echinata TaxID=191078 RepID=UPI002A7F93E4|nr:uncharacterized protein LOC133192971 [Saccostrea echinata]